MRTTCFGNSRAWLSSILVATVLTGCGSPYIHEKEQLGKATALTLDASKRTLLVNDKGYYCAEPSPDAVGTLATNMSAALSASLPSNKSGSANLNSVVTQDVVKLFERSQGIQALRDGMYRLCEARLNDAISREAYEEQIINLTATLNFVVPIELCTKVVRESKSDISPESYNQLILTCVTTAQKFALEIAESKIKQTKIRLDMEKELTKQKDANYIRDLIDKGASPEMVLEYRKALGGKGE